MPKEQVKSPSTEKGNTTVNQSPKVDQKNIVDEMSTERVVVGGIPQREILYKWNSPQRYFKKLNMRIYVIALACIIALFIMLILLGQYALMAAIAAVMFLVYVVGTIPPVKVPHIITNLAIETAGGVYEWEKMDTYWFAQRDNQVVLYVDMNMSFPGRLIMLVGPEDVKKTHGVLSKVVPYRDYRSQNRFSKMMNGEWIDMLIRETVEPSKQAKKGGTK